MIRTGPGYYRKEPSNLWLLIFLLLLWPLGCMEKSAPQPPTPQKQVVRSQFADQIIAVLAKQNKDISALAATCSEQEPSDSDLAKKTWNTQYHIIVGNSSADIQNKTKAAFDSAKTPIDRVTVWKGLERAYDQ